MRNARRPSRKRSIEVEGLESLTLLSGVATAAPVASIIPLPILVGLNGTTHGRYTSSSAVPDVGTAYTVLTSGRFAGYGPATVAGRLHSVGNILSGNATGTLTVVTARGTLTLALTGPTQGSFSPLPASFSFVITRGTGRFHNFVGDPVGQGAVAVSLTPDPNSSATHGHGRVTMVFHALIAEIL